MSKDSFYKTGVKLLVKKFFEELKDKKSDLHLMNECFEYKFEVWAKANTSTKDIQHDVFLGVIKVIKGG